MLKRSWLEIDVGIIRENFAAYRRNLDASMQIMAVVKADAYGHGATVVADALQKSGCRFFAVATLPEAIELREAGIEGEILILGYTPAEGKEELLRYDITQTLLSEEHAFSMRGARFKAQFAIDTGMNRIGLDGDDPENCEKIIRKYAPEFQLTGLFTHLCVADTPGENAFTQEQIGKFRRVAESVNDLHLPFIHCMNSAGGLWQAPYGNLARLGIILYGLKPDFSNTLPAGIRPAMQWKSVISTIKTLRPGETVGYGRTFRAGKATRLATIPVGYADGYDRHLSNRGVVLVGGKRAPVAGRVCMDQIMIDVTDIPEAHFETEVVLMGDRYNADDMARDVGTIGYEIVCGIGKRVPRIYL